MPDNIDEDVNFNTSYTGKATHTPTTHGSITKTYTHWIFSKNSTLPTLLQLDEQKYKKVQQFHQSIPILLLHSSQQQLERPLHRFYLYLFHKPTCLVPPPQFTFPRALLPPSSSTRMQAIRHSLQALPLHLPTMFPFPLWTPRSLCQPLLNISGTMRMQPTMQWSCTWHE